MSRPLPVSRLSLALSVTAWVFAALCAASLQWGATVILALVGIAQWVCSWWVHSSPSALAARGTPDGGPVNVGSSTRALNAVAVAALFLVLLVYVLAALFSQPFSDVRVLAMAQLVVVFGTWGITNVVFAKTQRRR